MRKLFLFLLCCSCFIIHGVSAQKNEIPDTLTNTQSESFKSDRVEMADTLRENGKIYVVVAVISVILTGLFIYLFALDRKIFKIEKLIKNNSAGKP